MPNAPCVAYGTLALDLVDIGLTVANKGTATPTTPNNVRVQPPAPNTATAGLGSRPLFDLFLPLVTIGTKIL